MGKHASRVREKTFAFPEPLESRFPRLRVGVGFLPRRLYRRIRANRASREGRGIRTRTRRTFLCNLKQCGWSALSTMFFRFFPTNLKSFSNTC